MTQRIRLDVGYDGTDFCGWATQPGQRSVQQTIEEAIGSALITAAPVLVTCAGRTDAGVHARGQVAHTDVAVKADADIVARLSYRLNRVLPNDITVFRSVVAPEGFHARFAALSRRYSYSIADGTGPVDPLVRRYAYAHRRPLDLEAMNAASKALLGTHNFAAFCRKKPRATTIRELLDLTWRRDERGLAVLSIKADAFCHSMVRSLVGAMISVGEERKPEGWLEGQLALTYRSAEFTVAPPQGLVLEEVEYPHDTELAGRAARTRARRVVPDGVADGEGSQ